jgi:hypothetical protein
MKLFGVPVGADLKCPVFAEVECPFFYADNKNPSSRLRTFQQGVG